MLTLCILALNLRSSESGVVTRHQADESHPNFYDPDSPALLALLASPQPNKAVGISSGLPAAPSSPIVVRQMSEDKYLDLEELEKAVLDLGIYPSHEEIESMHNALCADHPRKYADLEEFLDMVRVFTFTCHFLREHRRQRAVVSFDVYLFIRNLHAHCRCEH